MMSIELPFAINLTLASAEEPATRLAVMVSQNCCVGLRWKIIEIDATGDYGDWLTGESNIGRRPFLTLEDLLRFLLENGQVIELQVDGFDRDGKLVRRALISDGSYLDWLGFGEPPVRGEVGEYQMEACESFCWPEV